MTIFPFRRILCAWLSLLVTLIVGVMGAPRAAYAHEMPRSKVLLDIHNNGVEIELHLPVQELEAGFGKPLIGVYLGSMDPAKPLDPQETLGRYRGALLDYLTRHIGATASDGRAWKTEARDITMGPDETPPLWTHPVKFYWAHVWLTPPTGAPVRKFTFDYDLIVHQLVTHVALVSIRRDWNTGTFAGNPYVLGEVRFYNKTFAVDLTKGTPWSGFLSVVRLGMRHIAEGTDHLLFLLALLLPAALSVKTDGKNRRWNGPVDVRVALWRLLKIVSAFTIGHSLTLIAGAVGWVRPPEQPIEALIAVSIFVSAVHALRPLFPGREAWVAAGFGLIHGLSFAVVVADFGLDPWHTVLSIFGFNVGIEIMQLFVVAVTVPWLLLLARTPIYPYFRIGGATGAGIAAVAWTLERTFGWRNPIGDLVENVAHRAPYLVVGLAALAIVGTVATRVNRKKTVNPASSTERAR